MPPMKNMIATLRVPSMGGAPDEIGAAWEWNNSMPATLAAWLLHRPDAHPFWANYLVSIVHLRPIEGMPPAKKTSPEMTHELLVLALDPNHVPNPDDEKTCRPLQPANLVHQLALPDDATALQLVEQFTRALVDGSLNPDTDHRSCQKRWIEETLSKLRSTN